MLKVRVIKKYHDAKGILIGYTIQDESGQTMNVHKDQLKSAVASGQCEVINMTLTSDGRLIGKASTKINNSVNKNKSVQSKHYQKLIKICTNGRNIAAAIVDTIDPDVNQGNIKTLPGLKPGRVVHAGHVVMKKVMNGDYVNIEVIDGKPDLSKVQRGSFSTVRARLLNVVKSEYNDISAITFSVSKCDDKYRYSIKIDNFEDIQRNTDKAEELKNVIFSLVEDTCLTSKIKPIDIKGDTMEVRCLTGINDVRKALKLIKARK